MKGDPSLIVVAQSPDYISVDGQPAYDLLLTDEMDAESIAEAVSATWQAGGAAPLALPLDRLPDV